MGKDVIVACDFSSAEATFAFLDKFTGRKPFVKIGIAHHLLHVLQVSAIGTQVVLDALFVAYIYQYMVEHTALGVLAHGDRQSALKHIL